MVKKFVATYAVALTAIAVKNTSGVAESVNVPENVVRTSMRIVSDKELLSINLDKELPLWYGRIG